MRMSLAPGPSAPGQADSVSAVLARGLQEGDWDIMLQSSDPQDSSAGEQAAQAVRDSGTALSEGVRETIQSVTGVSEPHWPDRQELLAYCREADSIFAAVLLFFGIIYAAFGYWLFRMAATLNIAALGVWLGWLVGKQLDARLPAMVIGGVLFAALAWPAMRVAVAVCSGIVGFVIGVAVWRALGMSDTYAAAGGCIGGIFLFMLSFSLFKLSILAFTAAQGAVMFLGGLLGLVLKYPQVDEPVTQWVDQQPALLPITLLALSLIALLYQQHWNRAAGKDEDEK